MKIHELLTDETKWTKYCYAKDNNNRSVDPHNPRATCFCVHGAIVKCYDEEVHYSIVLKLEDALNDISLIQWNDKPERTFQEVKDLVTKLDV